MSSGLEKLPIRTRRAIARRWALGAMAVTLREDALNSAWAKADAKRLGLTDEAHEAVLHAVVAELTKQAKAPVGGIDRMPVPPPMRGRKQTE